MQRTNNGFSRRVYSTNNESDRLQERSDDIGRILLPIISPEPSAIHQQSWGKTSESPRDSLDESHASLDDGIPEKYKKSTHFGPGLWFAIHTYAANATTVQRKRAFLDFIYIIVQNIKCQVCRDHATQYVQDHPPERMYNLVDPDGNEIGLFKWTWIFHNAVNRRLGYDEMSFEEAYSIFAPGKPTCIKNCDKPQIRDQQEKIQLRYARSPTVIPTDSFGILRTLKKPIDNTSKTSQQGGLSLRPKVIDGKYRINN